MVEGAAYKAFTKVSNFAWAKPRQQRPGGRYFSNTVKHVLHNYKIKNEIFLFHYRLNIIPQTNSSSSVSQPPIFVVFISENVQIASICKTVD